MIRIITDSTCDINSMRKEKLNSTFCLLKFISEKKFLWMEST
jgi:fatty acid-binding protein DegV